MTGAAAPVTVAEFATGYLSTRILADGPDHLWIRSPGAARDPGFTGVPPAVRAALGAAAGPRPGARLVLGTEGTGPDGGSVAERRYRVESPYSLGHVLAGPQAAPRQWDALPELLGHCGRLLGEVHTRAPAPAALAAPRGSGRLADWLAGRAAPGHSGRLRDLARGRLGEARLDRAARWCSSLNSRTGPQVLLLGGLTLGSVVPTRDGRGCHVLAGEELARGPAGYDLGWALGELAEFRLLHFADGAAEDTARHCAKAGAALLHGYRAAAGRETPAADPDALARVAVLRILAHAHDFAAFVQWTDQLSLYLGLLADLIDHPRAALEAATGGQTAPGPTHPTEDQ
ncbi:hypothetical protein [Streptomyces sp. NRRL F-5650]|uniref:hypothetical protein n=1 Tax=Streptomyces sp. NRRL F-5650 TaxID=1463868 RepID=UPI0004CBB2DD|nr:hypothetical protein [Streptomyces sp. NRRL F-5650]